MMKEQEQLVDDESISLPSIPIWDFIGTKIEDPIVGIVFETMNIMQRWQRKSWFVVVHYVCKNLHI
jgi:hypothetical protein